MTVQGPPAMVRAASLALQANAIDLRKEFPLASLRILDQQGRSINTNSAALPDTVVAYCPSSMESIIHGKIQQAIQAVQVGTASIDISAADATAAARLASPTQLDKVAAQLRQDFKCCVLLALDAAKQICTVSTLGPLLPVVVSQLRAVLGLPSQLPQQPAAAAPQQHEQRAIQALLVRHTFWFGHMLHSVVAV